VGHPFFLPPFPEGVSLQNSEVYGIALIIAEYDLYFLGNSEKTRQSR
jgi:hypothetical protein